LIAGNHVFSLDLEDTPMLTQRMQQIFATALWFVAAIVVFGYVVLVFTGCGAGVGVTTAHAQSSTLSGTYIFKSQGVINGQPFFEIGTHTFNPDGTACTNSTMNTAGKVQRMTNYCGTYTVVGLAGSGQSQYDASDFVMSADQETFYAVGTTAGGTWSAEAHRQ
jgi:hypothetical protein